MKNLPTSINSKSKKFSPTQSLMIYQTGLAMPSRMPNANVTGPNPMNWNIHFSAESKNQRTFDAFHITFENDQINSGREPAKLRFMFNENGGLVKSIHNEAGLRDTFKNNRPDYEKEKTSCGNIAKEFATSFIKQVDQNPDQNITIDLDNTLAYQNYCGPAPAAGPAPAPNLNAGTVSSGINVMSTVPAGMPTPSTPIPGTSSTNQTVSTPITSTNKTATKNLKEKQNDNEDDSDDSFDLAAIIKAKQKNQSSSKDNQKKPSSTVTMLQGLGVNKQTAAASLNNLNQESSSNPPAKLSGKNKLSKADDDESNTKKNKVEKDNNDDNNNNNDNSGPSTSAPTSTSSFGR